MIRELATTCAISGQTSRLLRWICGDPTIISSISTTSTDREGSFMKGKQRRCDIVAVYSKTTCKRWGDAPVHSIAAAMMLRKEEFHFFNDIGYRHTWVSEIRYWIRGRYLCIYLVHIPIALLNRNSVTSAPAIQLLTLVSFHSQVKRNEKQRVLTVHHCALKIDYDPGLSCYSIYKEALSSWAQEYTLCYFWDFSFQPFSITANSLVQILAQL